MRPPIFVRSLTTVERAALQAGLRAADAFILRRCQMLWASAHGQTPPQIAQHLGCHDQTVRNTIRARARSWGNLIACVRAARDRSVHRYEPGPPGRT